MLALPIFERKVFSIHINSSKLFERDLLLSDSVNTKTLDFLRLNNFFGACKYSRLSEKFMLKQQKSRPRTSEFYLKFTFLHEQQIKFISIQKVCTLIIMDFKLIRSDQIRLDYTGVPCVSNALSWNVNDFSYLLECMTQLRGLLKSLENYFVKFS